MLLVADILFIQETDKSIMKTKQVFMQDKKVEINSQLIRIARIFSFPHKKIIENENSD